LKGSLITQSVAKVILPLGERLSTFLKQPPPDNDNILKTCSLLFCCLSVRLMALFCFKQTKSRDSVVKENAGFWLAGNKTAPSSGLEMIKLKV
jgi:hypothetical protein